MPPPPPPPPGPPPPGPPPPPAFGGSSMPKMKSGGGANERSALLSSIQQGKQLKSAKHLMNDRSGPDVVGKGSSPAKAGGGDMGSRPIIPTGPGVGGRKFSSPSPTGLNNTERRRSWTANDDIRGYDGVSVAPRPPPRLRNHHEVNKRHCLHPQHRHGKSPPPPPLPSQPPAATHRLHGVKAGYPNCLSHHPGSSSGGTVGRAGGPAIQPPVGLGGLFAGGMPQLRKTGTRATDVDNNSSCQDNANSQPSKKWPPVNTPSSMNKNSNNRNGPTSINNNSAPPPPPQNTKPVSNNNNSNGGMRRPPSLGSLNDGRGPPLLPSKPTFGGSTPTDPQSRPLPAPPGSGQVRRGSASSSGAPPPPPSRPPSNNVPPTLPSRPPSFRNNPAPVPPSSNPPPPPPTRSQPAGRSLPPPPPPARTSGSSGVGTVRPPGSRPPPPPSRPNNPPQVNGAPPLPPSRSGPPPTPPMTRVTNHHQGNSSDDQDGFEKMFKFRSVDELPSPDGFYRGLKTYPSQNPKNPANRRALPPPPPPR